MKEFIDKITRPSGKLTDQFIIAALISALPLVLLGSLVYAVVYKGLHLRDQLIPIMGSESLVDFFSQYLMFAGIWVAAFLFIIIRKANWPMLRAWGPNREGNNLIGIIAGLLLGFGTNGFCILMSVLTGDIKLSFYGFQPKILLLFLAAVFIQSAGEEITDRLYLYQKLRRRYRSPLVAIIGNTLVFVGLHVFNPGFSTAAASQIFLVGVIFSLLVYYYNSLWAAMCFHTAWNYTQNIIFGLPNSGIVSEYSIFKLEAASATSGLFYDVKFGVEGSIGASLVLIAVLIVILVINRKKPEKHDYWAAAE